MSGLNFTESGFASVAHFVTQDVRRNFQELVHEILLLCHQRCSHIRECGSRLHDCRLSELRLLQSQTAPDNARQTSAMATDTVELRLLGTVQMQKWLQQRALGSCCQARYQARYQAADNPSSLCSWRIKHVIRSRRWLVHVKEMAACRN